MSAGWVKVAWPKPAELLPCEGSQHTWSPARLRAGLLCRTLPGNRKPALGPYMDAGVPARPCGLAVWLTTLLALSSLGDTGCCGWLRGEAGCTAVEIRLLLGRCRRPRAGRQLAAAAGFSSAEWEHSTALQAASQHSNTSTPILASAAGCQQEVLDHPSEGSMEPSWQAVLLDCHVLAHTQ
jgi:hypothetical protein